MWVGGQGADLLIRSWKRRKHMPEFVSDRVAIKVVDLVVAFFDERGVE